MSNATAYAVAFLLRFIYAISQILTKASFDNGMSTSVFVFYRHLLASLFLVPIAFLLERRRAPPLSCKISFKLFLHALYGLYMGCLVWLWWWHSNILSTNTNFRMSAPVNIYSIGLNYTSATSGAAIFNLIPVIAFFIAFLLRMESMNMKRWHGIAKASGILFCIVGVAILMSYKGPVLKSIHRHHFLAKSPATSHGMRSKKQWTLGNFLTILAVIAWSLWTVLQGSMLEEYPSKVLSTTLQCIFATIQSFIIALGLERNFSRWRLSFNLNLLAIIYGGIAATGIAYYLQVWAIEKKGPIFNAMFMPLTLIFTSILSFLLLGEAISLGSVIGSVLMVGALYAVIWGKNREQIETIRKVTEEKQTYIQNKTLANCPEKQETLA